jgi:hypothetical protein
MLGRHSTTWAIPPALLTVVILEISRFLPKPAWTLSILFVLPIIAGMIGMSHFFICDVILWTLCLGWPWTEILPISALQVAKITGVRQWVAPHYLDLFRLTGMAVSYGLTQCKEPGKLWVIQLPHLYFSVRTRAFRQPHISLPEDLEQEKEERHSTLAIAFLPVSQTQWLMK